MMMSMYSGVSGLRAQQSKLDVIGNNIANVNTTGYKQQTVSFSDLLSQTLSGATAASTTTNRGGTNPKQIGLGVSVGSIDTIMTTGSTQSTGNSTDVSIGGSGFFIVQGGTTGDYQFTRAGNFGVDESGNLTVGGMTVCGWQDYGGVAQADGTYEYDTQKEVEPINLFSDSYNGNKKVIAPQATTAATLSGNLDPSSTAQGTALDSIGTDYTSDATSTMTVYDAQGNSYDVQVKFSKCYVDTTDADNPVTSWYWETDSTSSNLTASGSGYITFDADGKIITTDSTNHNTNPNITLTPTGDTASATAFDVSLDLTGISTYTSTSTSGVSVSQIDGYESGELQDFTIGSDGLLTGVYSNGQTQPLGMTALATFANSAGLEKIGTNLYITTANSGDFTGGVEAGTAGTGTLSSGTLEMSNVDLAQQFSEMMITQRAYQANSKIISTSDEMLETLVNLIR